MMKYTFSLIAILIVIFFISLISAVIFEIFTKFSIIIILTLISAWYYFKKSEYYYKSVFENSLKRKKESLLKDLDEVQKKVFSNYELLTSITFDDKIIFYFIFFSSSFLFIIIAGNWLQDKYLELPYFFSFSYVSIIYFFICFLHFVGIHLSRQARIYIHIEEYASKMKNKLNVFNRARYLEKKGLLLIIRKEIKKLILEAEKPEFEDMDDNEALDIFNKSLINLRKKLKDYLIKNKLPMTEKEVEEVISEETALMMSNHFSKKIMSFSPKTLDDYLTAFLKIFYARNNYYYNNDQICMNILASLLNDQNIEYDIENLPTLIIDKSDEMGIYE